MNFQPSKKFRDNSDGPLCLNVFNVGASLMYY